MKKKSASQREREARRSLSPSALKIPSVSLPMPTTSAQETPAHVGVETISQSLLGTVPATDVQGPTTIAEDLSLYNLYVISF